MKIVDISEVLLELGLSSSVTDEQRAITQKCITKSEGAVKRYLQYDPVQRERTEYYPQFDFSNQSRQALWEVSDNDAFLRRLAETASEELQVQHVPIRETPAIDLRIDYDGRGGTRDGSFDEDTKKTEGTDFWPIYDKKDSSGNRICTDGVIRSEGLWPDNPLSVQIIYTAGYTDAELHGQDTIIDASPILDAVIDETIRRAKKAFALMKKNHVGLGSGPFKSESLGDYSYSTDSKILERIAGSSTDLMPETKEKLQNFVNYGIMLAS